MPTHAGDSDLKLLQLLHLADSALPIGGAAHSFGLEALTDAGYVTAENLDCFLEDWIVQNGAIEVAACRIAHRMTSSFDRAAWRDLNGRLSAIKPARETRAASLALGRRFLILIREIFFAEALEVASEEAVHYSAAFGLSAGVLELREDVTALAFLHQSAANLVSASQRLLPVGQMQAMRLLWSLKPLITDISNRQVGVEQLYQVPCFAPLLETAAMRHPYLATRLFIS